MRGATVFPRWWLCLPVATVGAALADMCLESASNAGLFGPGRFTDGSEADVAPALLIGLTITAASLLRLVVAVIRHARGGVVVAAPATGAGGVARDLWVELGDGLRGPHGLRGLLAFAGACYCLQLAILCGMESAEQVAIYGHILGPWLWLGAPAAVALAVHALVCAGIIATLGVSLCSVLTCAPRLAQAILCYRRRMRGAHPAWHGRRRLAPCPVRTPAAAASPGQRSPPRFAQPLIPS